MMCFASICSLLTMCMLFATHAAAVPICAGVPDALQSSTTGRPNGTYDAVLDVTGYNSLFQPDPQDNFYEHNVFKLTVRDCNGDFVPSATVTLDFTDCFDTKICATMLASCSSPVVTLTASQSAGEVVTQVTGGGTNPGPVGPATSPGPAGPCMRVFAQGSTGSPVLLTTVKILTRDLNGAIGGPGVNGVDASILKAEILAVASGGLYRARDDLFPNGIISGPDLSVQKTYVLEFGSTLGCVDGAGAPQSYCP